MRGRKPKAMTDSSYRYFLARLFDARPVHSAVTAKKSASVGSQAPCSAEGVAGQTEPVPVIPGRHRFRLYGK